MKYKVMMLILVCGGVLPVIAEEIKELDKVSDNFMLEFRGDADTLLENLDKVLNKDKGDNTEDIKLKKLAVYFYAEKALRNGDKKKAQELYTKFQKSIERLPSVKGFEEGCIPATYYLESPISAIKGKRGGGAYIGSESLGFEPFSIHSELTGLRAHDYLPIGLAQTNVLPIVDSVEQQSNDFPFIGLGSATDNLLIKRFLEFEDYEMVLQEYDRMNQVHELSKYFSNRLQFKLDYAFFLQDQKKVDQATKLLSDELQQLYKLLPKYLSLRIAENDPFRDSILSSSFVLPVPPRVVSVDEFAKLAIGLLKGNGKLHVLKDEIQDSEDLSDLKLLIKIAELTGDEKDAEKLSLKYISLTEKNKEQRLWVEADYFFRKGKYEEATKHYLNLIQITSDIEFKRSFYTSLEYCYQKRGLQKEALEMRYNIFRLSPNVRLDEWQRFIGSVKENGLDSDLKKVIATDVKNVDAYSFSFRTMMHLYLKQWDELNQMLLACENIDIRDHKFWKESYDNAGKLKIYKDLLKERLEHKPKDASRLLYYIDLFDRYAELKHVISYYELLLTGESQSPYGLPTKGNIYLEDVGVDSVGCYLLSLYEKQGMHSSFHSLGEKLLKKKEKHGRDVELGLKRSCSYYIQRAGEDRLKELKKKYSIESKALDFQLNGWQEAVLAEKHIVTKVHSGASALLSSNSCYCLVTSDDLIVTGHEWGVTLYSEKGVKPHQICLGESIKILSLSQSYLYAASETTVFRVNLENESVQSIEFGGSENDSLLSELVRSVKSNLNIKSIYPYDKQLWIGGTDNIVRVNFDRMEVRVFTKEELTPDEECTWFSFTPYGENGIIATSLNNESVLYDPKEDTWSPLPRVINVKGEQLWVHYFVNERLGYRPALYDLQKGIIQVLKADKSMATRLWGEHVSKDDVYMNESQDADKFRYPYGIYQNKNGKLVRAETPFHEVRDDDTYKISNDWRNKLIGLIKYSHKSKKHTVLSDFSIKGDIVYDAEVFNKKVYLCTDRGINVTNLNGDIMCQIDGAFGIPNGSCVTVCTFNKKLYFGFTDGGVVELDGSRLRLFTKMNGLRVENIEDLEVEGGQLKIQYATFGHKNNPKRFDDSFMSVKGNFTHGGWLAKYEQANDRNSLPKDPINNGQVIGELEVNGKVWSYGVNGVVIREKGVSKHIDLPKLVFDIKMGSAPKSKMLAQNLLKTRKYSAAEAVRHSNPYLTLDQISPSWNKLENCSQLYLELLSSSNARIVSKAIDVLDPKGNAKVLAKLSALMDSSNEEVCMRAIAECVEHADEVPLGRLREIAQNRGVVSDAMLRRVFRRKKPINLDTLRFTMERVTMFNDWFTLTKDESLEYISKSSCEDYAMIDVILSTSTIPRRSVAYQLMQGWDPKVLPYVHQKLKSEDRVIRANAALACSVIGDASSVDLLIDALDLESGLSKASILLALAKLKTDKVKPILEELKESLIDEKVSDRYATGALTVNTVSFSKVIEPVYATDDEFRLPSVRQKNYREYSSGSNEYLLTKYWVEECLQILNQ